MTTKTAPIPLVVDLDGTLIHSDLLVESFFSLLASAPQRAIRALFTLRRGRAAFKAAIARHAKIDVTTLPYNKPLLAWLRDEKTKGRTIYIASASQRIYVQQVADHLGFISGIFASDEKTNLRSDAKAEALCATFGCKMFDYVGNESADIAVWDAAAGVVITGASTAFEQKMAARYPQAMAIPTPPATMRDYRRALRPHQWLKNSLIFVPALVGHQFDAASILACLLAFISFSLCASGGYILNDLIDLRHDRQHHSKRNRPFASGRIGLRRGAQLMLASLGLSAAISLFLPAHFLLVLASYFLLTLAYSTTIKRRMMLDVITLSLLYGVRLVAGGAALAIPLSAWLLSFATFFFLSLALIKRCSELVARQQLGHGDPSGRGYRLTDLPMLASMATAAGYVAALTSGLYINSPKVIELYNHPDTLWAIPIILLFWISRMLLLTHRGEMHDDPVLFAARDRVSLICGGLLVVVLIMSM